MGNEPSYEQQYFNEVYSILKSGRGRGDRTGTGTLSKFHTILTHNFKQNDSSTGWSIPLMTHKKVNYHAIFTELAWMLNGSTNVKWLQQRGVHIWDEWADEEGRLGPIYGKLWRGSAGGVDQISACISSLKKDPMSRRHIISTWDSSTLPRTDMHPKDNPKIGRQALAPCHGLVIQFYANNRSELDCFVYQRSADMMLGVPYNAASYATLVILMAAVTGLVPGRLIHCLGDAHIYIDHFTEAEKVPWLSTHDEPHLSVWRAPSGALMIPQNLQGLEPYMVELHDYMHGPAIKFDVSV